MHKIVYNETRRHRYWQNNPEKHRSIEDTRDEIDAWARWNEQLGKDTSLSGWTEVQTVDFCLISYNFGLSLFFKFLFVSSSISPPGMQITNPGRTASKSSLLFTKRLNNIFLSPGTNRLNYSEFSNITTFKMSFWNEFHDFQLKLLTTLKKTFLKLFKLEVASYAADMCPSYSRSFTPRRWKQKKGRNPSIYQGKSHLNRVTFLNKETGIEI